MSAALKRGACPSLHAPMQTGDGLLLRIGFDAGVAPSGLTQIAHLAGRLGNGIVEITARGSLQIRGLDEQTAPQIAEAIEALGMPLRSGVPVETTPLSGIDPAEISDPRPLAAAIRSGIAKEGLTARLGPKVSVIVDGGGKLRHNDSPADIRLTADGAQWLVSVGGTAQTAGPLAFGSESEAVRLTLDMLKRIAALGLEGRGRDLNIEGEQLALTARPPIRSADPIGLHTLTEGRTALGIGLPFGQIEHDRLEALMDAAAALGVSEIRLAPARALLAVCPGNNATKALRRYAAKLGFITNASDPRLAIITCAGKPACGSAFIATKAIAAEIAAMSANGFDRHFRLHVSGCEKRCAGMIAEGVTIIGTSAGARLAVEGQPEIIETSSQDVVSAATALAQRFHGKKSAKRFSPGFSRRSARSSVAGSIQPETR